MSGELVGITTARSNHGEGIGFAIPIDRIRKFLGALEDGDWGRSGVVGVFVDSEPDVSKRLSAHNYMSGVMVDRVVPEGPAEKAGLRAGDILVEMRGRRYDEFGEGVRGRYQFMIEFGRVVRLLRPGEELPLTVLRGEEVRNVSIVVEAASAARQARIDAARLLGVKLREDDSRPIIEAVLPDGEVGKIPGAVEGLRGLEITGILGRSVGSVEELGEILEKLKRWRTSRRVIRIRFRDPLGRERTMVGYPLGSAR
jgi:serine protease Do